MKKMNTEPKPTSPEPVLITTYIKITKEDLKALRKRAADRDESGISSIVRELIQNYLAN